jgi:hypothetical protein
MYSPINFIEYLSKYEAIRVHKAFDHGPKVGLFVKKPQVYMAPLTDLKGQSHEKVGEVWGV